MVIVEKTSGKVLRYDDLEGTAPPVELASNYFDAFVEEIIPQMPRGAERTYLLYMRAEGLRPDVNEVRVTNKTMRAERRVMGYPGPGAIEIIPYQVNTVTRSFVKKGEFPRPPGADPSLDIEDDGIDEAAIKSAIRNVYALLRTAINEEFNEASRQALLIGMRELLRSTGVTGDEPREDWYFDGSPDGDAMDFYDCAALLWLKSDAAHALPQHIADGHRQRMEEDPKRAEQIDDVARMIRRGSF